MTEPKKRGRPSKADIAAREGGVNVPAINGDHSGQLERVEDERDDSVERAQAYAMRVWAGQAVHLSPQERIARCERALIAQGLPTDGVKYPREEQFRDDGDDDEPVTWRMKLPKAGGVA